MYSFTQQGMAFSISFLQCCGVFLTAVLSLDQFQTFWSPTAPCTSFNCYSVLTTKPKAHRKSLTHDSVDWRKKKSGLLPCKHCILHLQSVVMKQLTLRKATNYHSKRTFKCSTPYPPIITGLLPNKLNESTSLHNARPTVTGKSGVIVQNCANFTEKTMHKKKERKKYKGLHSCRYVA